MIIPVKSRAATSLRFDQASRDVRNADPVNSPQTFNAMTSSSRGRGATYAESTKLQIIRAVLSQPGRTGRQIAESLGLDRSRVNSFLYGEGKRRFGLMESNWRWYPGRMHDSWVSSSRTVGSAHQDARAVEVKDSVCAILSKMSVTNATLKIRTLSLTLVELAFSEDEYPTLDERLQAELIIRKKTLESVSKEIQVVKQEPNRWAWIIIVALGAWILMLLNNQKHSDPQDNLQWRREIQRISPSQ